MPGHYSGMSFERGRGSTRSRSAGRGSGFSSGGSGRTYTSSSRQRVTDTSATRSPRDRAAERSRTNRDGTRSANQQNDSSAAAAIRNIQQREENNPLKGMPSILAGVGSAMRQRMISLLEQGGTPVYDPSGKLAIGVMFNGKYTGRPRNTGDQGGGDDNDRPAAAASTVDQNPPATNPPDDTTRPPAEPPAPPGDSPVDTTTDEAVDARRRRGRQTTIATSPRGLLGPARTRRRSLMAGLIR